MRSKCNINHGFSLVELSIVLVILGLLVGGILAGQSLIRAAELRKVTAQVESFKRATLAYKDKYLALPGDMSNASSFFTGCSCDGNGSGRIVDAFDSSQEEAVKFWHALSLAGLIEGNFRGVTAGANPAHSQLPGTGIRAPAPPINNLATYGTSTLTGAPPTGWRNSVFFVLAGGPYSDDGALVPIDSWNIDKKMDDGEPSNGKVWSTSTNTATASARKCFTSTVDIYGTNYDFSYTGNDGCRMFFIGF